MTETETVQTGKKVKPMRVSAKGQWDSFTGLTEEVSTDLDQEPRERSDSAPEFDPPA